jgi:hypothetical protein
VSAPPTADGDGVDERLSGDWSVLVAGALEPRDLSSPAGEVVQVFGELGFADLLTDPGAARDQCIDISETFASMCCHRGIPAQAVTGFLIARIPPFAGEVIVCGHTAVRLPAPHADGCRDLAIDWTARQFDPGVRVPLVVTLEAWRAVWRDLGTGADPAVPKAGPDRRSRRASPSGRENPAYSQTGLEFPAAPAATLPASPGRNRLPKPPPAAGPSPNASTRRHR